MNFFKQAQEFAASANTNTDGDNNSAAQGAAPADDGSAAPGSLPGGRQAPTNQELLQSGQVWSDFRANDSNDSLDVDAFKNHSIFPGFGIEMCR